jgi:hypothetical protein
MTHLDNVKALTKQNRVATMLNNAATLDDLQSIMTLNAPDKSHVHVVVIEGVSGSGKTAAAAYYKVHARRNNMRLCHIVAKPGEEKVKYGVIRRLFMELLGPKASKADEQVQKSVLKRLLRDVPWTHWTGSSPAGAAASSNPASVSPLVGSTTGMDKAMRTKLVAASVCSVDDQIYALAIGLGLMSLVEFMFPTPETDGSTAGDAAQCPEDSAVKAHLTDDVIECVIVVALQSLVSKTVQVILVEDAHYLDKGSWAVLRMLMEMPIAASICLTSRHLQAVGGNGHTPTNTESAGFLGVVKKFFSGGETSSSKSNKASVESGIDANKFKVATSFNVNRHSEILETYEAVTKHPRSTYIQMVPLTFKEVKKLMEQQLKGMTASSGSGKPEVPVVLNDKVIQVILEISSGNIFWIKEIATFIVEHGVEEFNCKINVREDQKGANPLQVLVICRLEKLTTEEQVALRHAAVIGIEFGLHLLASIMPFKLVVQIDNIMGALLNSSFIELSESDNEHFVFSNSAIHQIIHDLTPPG